MSSRNETRLSEHEDLVFYDGVDDDIDAALRSGQADAWFEHLEAQRWIDSSRMVTDGRLDIDLTAAELAIPFMYAPLRNRGRMIGRPGGIGSWAIQVSTRCSEAEQRITGGHELGHLFLVPVEERYEEGMGYSDEEAFCDHFGRFMAIPPHQLEEEVEQVSQATIEETMERYGADLYSVIIQLMLARKLPRTILIDSLDEEKPNPYYSNKVNRNAICIDCELRKPHETPDRHSLPVYDFTGKTWTPSLYSPLHNLGICEVSPDHDDFRELNILYGRWTDEDESMHAKEKILFYEAIHRPDQTAGNPEGYEWLLRQCAT